MRASFCLAALFVGVASAADCKVTPSDPEWPSDSAWADLNTTVAGSLIRTVPVASSCYSNNTHGSGVTCDEANKNWGDGMWHSQQPESIDYPLYANNSCLPDKAAGYSPGQNCSLGGYPTYIVNATEEQHVAVAVKWASERNIRIVVKGTGHDLNGRSSGAFSLSIWTRNLRNLSRDTAWTHANSSSTEDVYIAGSGQQWGNILTRALSEGRIVTTGQDPSVGLGGYIQGGGHGPISSTYGLASAQVLQMRVATTSGDVLVANSAENQDLFWALRGGGAGQYGIVTEYVIKHYPAPSNVVSSVVQMKPNFATNESFEASWSAAATWLSLLPDLMDAGLAGAATVATGDTAPKFFPDVAPLAPFKGVAFGQVFWAFNTTVEAFEAHITPAISKLLAEHPTASSGNGTNSTLAITMSPPSSANYSTFYSSISGSDAAGGASLVSSRLLGRAELVHTPHDAVVAHLKTALETKNITQGSFATIGLQGGPGVRNTPIERRGALLPAWQDAYLHFIANNGDIDTTNKTPQTALEDVAVFYEDRTEKMWREWNPEGGAYMNEANAFNKEFKHDFYGENYEQLLEIKKKFDPRESLYVLSGVGSDGWDYNLDSGKLCRVSET